MKRRLLTRTLALFLILGLALPARPGFGGPSPAWALRPTEVAQQETGLEELAQAMGQSGLEERWGLTPKQFKGLQYLWIKVLQHPQLPRPSDPEVVETLIRELNQAVWTVNLLSTNEKTLAGVLIGVLTDHAARAARRREQPSRARSILAWGAAALLGLVTVGGAGKWVSHLWEQEQEIEQMRQTLEEGRRARKEAADREEAIRKEWTLIAGSLEKHPDFERFPSVIRQAVQEERAPLIGHPVSVSGKFINPEGQEKRFEFWAPYYLGLLKNVSDGNYAIELRVDEPFPWGDLPGSPFQPSWRENRWLLLLRPDVTDLQIKPAYRPRAGLEEQPNRRDFLKTVTGAVVTPAFLGLPEALTAEDPVELPRAPEAIARMFHRAFEKNPVSSLDNAPSNYYLMMGDEKGEAVQPGQQPDKEAIVFFMAVYTDPNAIGGQDTVPAEVANEIRDKAIVPALVDRGLDRDPADPLFPEKVGMALKNIQNRLTTIGLNPKEPPYQLHLRDPVALGTSGTRTPVGILLVREKGKPGSTAYAVIRDGEKKARILGEPIGSPRVDLVKLVLDAFPYLSSLNSLEGDEAADVVWKQQHEKYLQIKRKNDQLEKEDPTQWQDRQRRIERLKIRLQKGEGLLRKLLGSTEAPPNRRSAGLEEYPERLLLELGEGDLQVYSRMVEEVRKQTGVDPLDFGSVKKYLGEGSHRDILPLLNSNHVSIFMGVAVAGDPDEGDRDLYLHLRPGAWQEPLMIRLLAPDETLSHLRVFQYDEESKAILRVSGLRLPKEFLGETQVEIRREGEGFLQIRYLTDRQHLDHLAARVPFMLALAARLLKENARQSLVPRSERDDRRGIYVSRLLRIGESVQKAWSAAGDKPGLSSILDMALSEGWSPPPQEREDESMKRRFLHMLAVSEENPVFLTRPQEKLLDKTVEILSLIERRLQRGEDPDEEKILKLARAVEDFFPDLAQKMEEEGDLAASQSLREEDWEPLSDEDLKGLFQRVTQAIDPEFMTGLEAAFQEAVSAAPVRFVGKTAQVGGQAIAAEDLPELLAQIPVAERDLFFREDGETIAVTLGPEVSLPAGMRAFDQIGIGVFPVGVDRIPLGLGMGQVIPTLIEKEAGRADAVFFSSDKVFRYAVTYWLPEANRPLDQRPAVVVAHRGQTDGQPASVVAAMVRAADSHPERILMVQHFTIVQVRGQQLLLISA